MKNPIRDFIDGESANCLTLADLKAIRQELGNVIEWAFSVSKVNKVEFNPVDKTRLKVTLRLLKGLNYRVEVYNPINQRDAFIYLRRP
jgi:hypothetical protein